MESSSKLFRDRLNNFIAQLTFEKTRGRMSLVLCSKEVVFLCKNLSQAGNQDLQGKLNQFILKFWEDFMGYILWQHGELTVSTAYKTAGKLTTKDYETVKHTHQFR